MTKLFNLKSKSAVIRAKGIFALCVTLCFLLGNVTLSPLSEAMAKTTNTNANAARIKSVVNLPDFYVDNGTTSNQLKKLLPSTVNVVMENKTKSTATVTWNTANYVSKVKSTKSFTLTGKVKETKLKAEIKVIVANPYIKAIKTPASITVANGTKAGNLNLPKYVSVTKSNDTTANAKVIWDTSTYNGNVTKATTFVLKGNVKGTENIATITVKVAKPFIKSARKPCVLVVDNGTTLQQLNTKLPTDVSVKLSNGKTDSEKITWDTTGYNGNVEKGTTYTFEGTLVKYSEITTTITVKVGEPFIAEIKAPSAISVDNNTTLEQVKAKLPQTVEVKVSNGIDSTAKVTWDLTGYNGNTTVAKVFEFTGTVENTSKTTTISIHVAAPSTTPVTPPQPQVDPWTLVWSDEFNSNGTHLDTNGLDLNKWGYQNGTGAQYGLDGWGNNEQQYYSSDNIEVTNGNLVITPEIETIEGKPYSSGRLWTSPTFTKKYGKFEARMKLPVGQGFWPAFWMMPKSDIYGGWAASGELDIMEARGSEPTKVGGTIHYGGAWPSNKYTGKDYTFTGDKTINDFHTYAIEWEPGEIRWYVDGVLYQTQNNWSTLGIDGEEKYAFPAPYDQEFYIIINLAIGGNYVGNVVPGQAEFASNPTMEVDYVRVYELVGRPYKTPVEPNIDAEPLPEGGRVPDANGNLVFDMNFEQGINENAEGIDTSFGDGWNFIHNAQFGGQATATIDSIDGKNFGKIDVSNVGNQPYSVQLEQHTTLTKGRWYQFSFDAKADKNRTLSTKLGGGPTAGWTAYSDSYTFNLNTEMQSFNKVFQMTKSSDILTRIEFNCATSLGPVWIGNVKVIEVDPPQIDYNISKEPLPNSGNHIYNGAFDKYTIDRMSYWTFNVATDADATANVPESTRELNINIVNGGTSSDSIKLVQKGMELQRTDEYKVTMKARSLSNRTIEVSLLSKDGQTNYSGVNTINLTSSMEEKTFTFTMPDITDLEGQFVINIGGNDADVCIDDVQMVRLTNYNDNELSLDNQFPLKNGDFSNANERWSEHVQGRYDGWGSCAVFEVQNSEMKIAVANEGVNPWDVMLMQTDFPLFGGNTYTVSIDIRSTIAREAELVVDAGGVRHISEKIGLTTTKQTFSYELKPSMDLTASFKLLLGKIVGASELGAHDVYVDNIRVEVKGARDAAFPLKNGTFVSEKDSWSEHVQGRYDGWGSSAEFTVPNGELKIAIANEGVNPWDVMLMQTDFQLYEGKTYMVSFDIRSTIARDAELVVDASNIRHLDKKIALTSTKQTISYELQPISDLTASFKLLLGKIEGAGALNAHDIYIDNIRLEVKGAKEATGEVFETGVQLITSLLL